MKRSRYCRPISKCFTWNHWPFRNLVPIDVLCGCGRIQECESSQTGGAIISGCALQTVAPLDFSSSEARQSTRDKLAAGEQITLASERPNDFDRPHGPYFLYCQPEGRRRQDDHHRQIGRASCRERVETSVLA